MPRSRAASLLLALLLALGTLVVPASAAATFVDPQLQARLATALPDEQVEAVVNFDPTITSGAALASAIQNLGAATITFNNLDSVAVLGTAGQLNAVAGLAGVTELYANRQLTYYLNQSVPFIGADRVWSDFGVTGKGIGVAILDTGIDGTHPDVAFPSKTVQNVKIVFNERDVFTTRGKPATKPLFLENQQNSDTSSGHGTHVAGTAAGSGTASGGFYTGVAKEANLVGLGAGDTLFIFWALAGFDYLIDHAAQYNIKVVNNSWGTTARAADFDPKDPINRASKKAHDRGITVVFAAGNDGPDQDTMNHYVMAPWVIGAAAGCTPQDRVHCPDGLLTDFSSRGVPGGVHPTLTAPGAHIVSARALTGTTLNVLDANHDLTICPISAQNEARYTCASGTSMATPHVVGTVALMQQAAGGKLSPDRIKDILVQTARPMLKNDGTAFAVWEVGAGYLDAFAAVRAARR